MRIHIRSLTRGVESVKPPWRILFFGTDRFSLYPLKALLENKRSVFTAIGRCFFLLDTQVYNYIHAHDHVPFIRPFLKQKNAVYSRVFASIVQLCSIAFIVQRKLRLI